MYKHFLKISKKSFAYFIANSIQSFIGIITLPLYTRFLTPNDYGICGITASITSFLTAFYLLGLMAAYNRFYFNYKVDSEKQNKYISTIVYFIIFYGLLLTLILTIFGGPLEVFTEGVPFYPYIILAIWSSYFTLIIQLRLQLYRTEQKSKKYTALFVADIFFRTILSIYFVVFLKKGALGFIAGGLISSFVFSLISMWLVRRHIVRAFDTNGLKASLKYGLPLVPHQIGTWMFNLSDRLILNKLISTSEVGLYSVGNRVSTLMHMVAMSINFAWSPFFFSIMKGDKEAAKKKITRLITYWIMVMCFTFLVTVFFSKELIIIFAAPEYRTSYRVVPLLALGYLFQGFYFVVVNPLFLLGNTYLVTIATITGGLLNIGLNFLFIPKMSMMGAALATAITYFYIFIFIAFFSIRLFKIPYEHKRIFKIIIITALFSSLLFPINYIDIFWISLVLKILLTILFLLVFYFIPFLDVQEKSKIKNITSKVKLNLNPFKK